MIEVGYNLYVGNEEDYNVAFPVESAKDQWSFIGAAKYPWHKQHAKPDYAEEEGYIGKALPKGQKEYLFAEREHALYCNLIDVDNPVYIPDEIIDKCIGFIDKEILSGRKVLICCNQGESRAPSIALIYLIYRGEYDDCVDYDFMQKFKEIYPAYNPKAGIGVKVIERFDKRREIIENG